MNGHRLVLVLAAAAGLAAQAVDADVLLQRAIRKESIEGDLNGAIGLYRKVIASAGRNRAAAARALLRLGECHEKQGNAEAQKSYERLVREFSDQAEQAREAQTRLAAMGQTRDGKTVMAQLIARGSDLGAGGRVTADGKLYVFVDLGATSPYATFRQARSGASRTMQRARRMATPGRIGPSRRGTESRSPTVGAWLPAGPRRQWSCE